MVGTVLLSLTALTVLFVALTPPDQQAFQQDMSPTATPSPTAPTHDHAALLSVYHAARPPDGLTVAPIDAAAKDACTGLAKMTNSLPGEREKVAIYFTIRSLQSTEANGLINPQPSTIRLAQAHAIVAAAEEVYCPGTSP